MCDNRTRREERLNMRRETEFIMQVADIIS